MAAGEPGSPLVVVDFSAYQVKTSPTIPEASETPDHPAVSKLKF